MKLLGLFIALIFVGFGGGFLTKLISRGIVPVWTAMIPSVISGLIWGFMSKSRANLSLLAMLYDIIYTVSYVIVFVVMGDKMTPVQACGFFVALTGVVMMSR